jgi:hypothetical protein
MLLLETPKKNRAETFPGSNEFLVVLMVCNQTRSLHLKMEKAATEFPAIHFSHRNKRGAAQDSAPLQSNTVDSLGGAIVSR